LLICDMEAFEISPIFPVMCMSKMLQHENEAEQKKHVFISFID
jgi:hypothetical protein